MFYKVITFSLLSIALLFTIVSIHNGSSNLTIFYGDVLLIISSTIFIFMGDIIEILNEIKDKIK
jgi:hypothetical protein